MKYIFTGIGLFLFPMFTSAEMQFVSEILVGKVQNKFHSFSQSGSPEEYFSGSLKSNSYGLRVGIKFTHNITFEFARHGHGKVANHFIIQIPTVISGPSGPVFLSPEFDTIVEGLTPIEVTSIRLGIKGEMEVFKNTFVNARLGLAHWQYDKFTPQQLTRVGSPSIGGENGNDIYYSLGAEYRFSENFHLGIEYSLLTINESTDGNSLVSGSYRHDVRDLSLVLTWAF